MPSIKRRDDVGKGLKPLAPKAPGPPPRLARGYVKAPCSVYRKCSGCSRMQFPYVKQLHDKTKAAREALARYLPLNESPAELVRPVTPSPAELGYRTSTKLCLGEDAFGRNAVGLYERGTKKIVPIPACPVHHPAINHLVAKLTGGRTPMPAPFYDHMKRTFQVGRLKFLTVRHCPATDAFGVVLSHTGVAREDLARWAALVAQPNVSFYEAPLAKADDDLVLSDRASHLAGPPDLPFAIGDRTFRLSPLAFFQANFALTGRFVEHITDGIGGGTLLDLYGGFGAYGLAAAERFKRTFVVDANQHAVDGAKRALDAQPVKGAAAVKSGVEIFLEKRLTPADRKAVTHVIANPPRGGLSPRVKAQLEGTSYPALTGLTYVSCNLDTLKRDLATLTGKGRWRIESVVPFDMFPQTDHLELVVKMTRAPSQGRAESKGRQRPSKVGRRTEGLRALCDFPDFRSLHRV